VFDDGARMSAEQKISFKHYKAGEIESADGKIIVERRVSLFVNGHLWLTFMCTPIDLDALAVGFLFTEGVLTQQSDLREVLIHPEGHMVEVWLNKEAAKPENWRFTSGCAGGVVSADKTIAKVPMEQVAHTAEEVIKIATTILAHKGLHENVGGVHTSAVFEDTVPVILCEDIGRHNTLDKLAGRMFLEQVSGKNKVIATSGRISSEMLQKAASMGVGMVISRTSPTSLSIQLAEEYQITMVGYARGRKFRLYAHPERILDAR
jgi:FdhD protein